MAVIDECVISFIVLLNFSFFSVQVLNDGRSGAYPGKSPF